MSDSRVLFTGPLRKPEFLTQAKPVNREPRRGGARSKPLSIVLTAALAAGNFLTPVGSAVASSPATLTFPQTYATYSSRQVREWAHWLKGPHLTLPPRICQGLQIVFTDLIAPLNMTPDGASTPEGSYLLTWKVEEHHLELELFEDHWEWFYKNTKTGRLKADDEVPYGELAGFRIELLRHI